MRFYLITIICFLSSVLSFGQISGTFSTGPYETGYHGYGRTTSRVLILNMNGTGTWKYRADYRRNPNDAGSKDGWENWEYGINYTVSGSSITMTCRTGRKVTDSEGKNRQGGCFSGERKIEILPNGLKVRDMDNAPVYIGNTGGFKTDAHVNEGINNQEKKGIEGILKDNQLSSDLTNFVNLLSQDSDNPKLQALANEMYENQNTFQNIKTTASYLGTLDQSSIEFLNMTENLTQAISIGKAIFGANKKEEVQLSQSQQDAREIIKELSSRIRMIYDEASVIPFYNLFNEETLKKLELLEERIANYEFATAKERLLYFKYIDLEYSPPLEELNGIINTINAISNAQAIQEIDAIQRKYNTKNIPHIANKERGFAGVSEKIKLYKARCYENMGDKAMANKIRESLSFKVSINDAIKLTLEAYNQNDFYATTKYTQIIFDYFQNETDLRLMYPDLMSINYNFEGLYRSDINFLMTLGVLSNAKTNQISQANLALEALIHFHNTFENTFQNYKDKKARTKAFGISDEAFRLEMLRSKAIVYAAKAYIQSNNQNNDKALDLINDAIALYQEAPEQGFQKYETWLLYNKLEILVNLESYDAAKELMRDIKSKTRLNIQGSSVFIKEKSDIDFINAFIRFKTEDYNGALMAIKILKSKVPDSPRLFALEKEVYLALGDSEKANQSEINYLNIINQKQ